MVAYLANGWFTQVGPRRLRAEVVDGALDSAALLHQNGVPIALLDALLLRLRTLAFLLSRERAAGGNTLSQAERDALRHHLQEATDDDFTLQAFMIDCLEHVGDVQGLRALYVHVMHVAHVCRLLRLAKAQHPVAAAAQDLAISVTAGNAPMSQAVAWQAPR